ncbi:UNVERIFIED_CONTAM: hypothetical protein FKN15_059406 [Acipenser sinensis]
MDLKKAARRLSLSLLGGDNNKVNNKLLFSYFVVISEFKKMANLGRFEKKTFRVKKDLSGNNPAAGGRG